MFLVIFYFYLADEVCKNRLGITNIKSETKKKDDQSEYSHLPEGQEAHWEIVQRILFIFAKLNPGNSYVQGKNVQKKNV